MTYSWPIYIILTIVAVVSLATAFVLPTADILRWVSSVPALVALIGVVWQILRDHAQYEKSLAIQRNQQHFILGVTSHMANVAFDKHVAFCEQYITQIQVTMSTLFREGPTRECLALASKLADIRLSFRTWLTIEIQGKILPFEEALVRIASKDVELETLPVGDVRTKAVEEMHNTYADILGLARQEGRGNNDSKVVGGRIIDHIQDILGVKQLIRLRIDLVDESVKTLEAKR